MLGCDKTVTVVNSLHDPDADNDIPCITELSGVSWYAAMKTTAGTQGLQSACLYRCRIPNALCAGYLPPEKWVKNHAEHWTLRPGDAIAHDGVTATILSVHDNRAGRQNPHLYVEAS